MKAVILAGGEGVRLRPLTCDRPKPMLNLLGKPVLEYILGHLSHHHVSDAYVTLQYLPQRVMEYFGREQAGIRLHYALEEQPLGTAGCVKQLQKHLTEPFAVISGDALTDVDLTEAMRWHKEQDAEVTLVLSKVDTPVEYGIVTLDGRGRVERFQEKPGWSEVFSNLANTGIYILNPSVLDEIPSDGFFDFSKDLFPRLMAKNRVITGYVSPGYWCDIGSHEDYLAAQFDLLEGRCRLEIPGYPAAPGIVIAPDAVIEGDAQTKAPCYIGPGCRILPGASVGPRAVLEENCVVDREASVRNSLVGKNCRIDRRAQIRGAILSELCRVKAGAEIYEGSVVAEKTVIGAFARLLPGTKIWPQKRVDDYSRLKGAVRWGHVSLTHPMYQSALRAGDWEELPPERIFAWGEAMAAVCPEGVALSDFGGQQARAVRETLQAGIRCAGGRLYPLEGADLAMHRFGQRALDLGLGAHVAGHCTGFSIHFVGEGGEELSREAARKMENWVRRGVEPADKLREPARTVQVEPLYLAYLRRYVSARDRQGPAVIFCNDPDRLELAGRLMTRLERDVHLVDKTMAEDRSVPSSEYRVHMLRAGAGIGLVLYDEDYGLMGARGEPYQDWQLQWLLEKAVPEETLRMTMAADGLLSLLVLQAETQGDLDGWAARHPGEQRQEKRVPCPWPQRGKVVSALAAWPGFSRQGRAYVGENDRLTIAPMDDLPLIRLITRNLSSETAQEMLGEYEKKLLEQLQQEKE